ncbi:MAG: hypothetical protein AAFU79_28075, partial [Myxococcota bacterium]
MSHPNAEQAEIDWGFLLAMFALIAIGGSTRLYMHFQGPEERLQLRPASEEEAARGLSPSEAGPAIPYDLEAPDWMLVLPPSLKEVSAFALDEGRSRAWVVNDEQGQIYPIGLSEREVGQPIRFAGKGDYEGVEVVGDEVVAARSDGTLWRIREGEVVEVRSPLSAAQDVEGLAFDPKRSRLLVACKGKAGTGKDYAGTRAIYALSVPEYRWEDAPAYLIALSDLEAFIRSHNVRGLKPKDAKHFAPSGIAVSPDGRAIYVISSVGRMMVALNVEGEIAGVTSLPRERHSQPEG